MEHGIVETAIARWLSSVHITRSIGKTIRYVVEHAHHIKPGLNALLTVQMKTDVHAQMAWSWNTQ